MGEVEYFEGSGTPIGTGYDTLTIVGSTEIEGEIWYQFNDGVLRKNGPEGTWFRFGDPNGDTIPRLYTKYPAVRGDTFASFRTTFGNGQPGPWNWRQAE